MEETTSSSESDENSEKREKSKKKNGECNATEMAFDFEEETRPQ